MKKEDALFTEFQNDKHPLKGGPVDFFGKKASVDGSVICTYNCDGFGFASPLSYSPAGKHAPGEMIALRGMGPGGGEARLIPQVE